MTQSLMALQTWLNARGATPKLVADGKPGPKTRAAIITTFANRSAPAITHAELANYALRLGGTVRQIKAVAKVESAGGGFDDDGLLKCLWERHYLWRRVKFAVPFLSDPKPGGYTMDADGDGICDSWEKLADAAMRWPALAFECASFGKFQVMGAHWKSLGYRSAIDMVWQMSRTEAAHYEVLVRYIEANSLIRAFQALSDDPADCLPLALGYNGPGQRGYHQRLAAAFQEQRA